MKLPTSSLVVYSSVYSLLFFLSIVLNIVLLRYIYSPLYRVYAIDLLITIILFVIGNFIFLSNNVYDLHWPLLPLICSMHFYLTTNHLESLSLKSALLFLPIYIWSSHLIWQTIEASSTIQNEDWRYQFFRKQYNDHFLVFSFFALHILPMIEVLIGSTPIYYIFLEHADDQSLTLTDILIITVMFSGVLLENVADRQLHRFRQYKVSNRDRFAILSEGLWKYSRHPNYLGELIFWWSLFAYGCLHSAPIWTGLGALLITVMMIFGSIPISEDRMYRKYPGYKFIRTNVPMLIPTLNIFQ